MKIGYDGKRALFNMTGLGNYSRLIIESMARNFPTDEIRVYAPRPNDNPRIGSWSNFPNIMTRFPDSKEARHGKNLWRLFGIPEALRGDGVEIYHGLSNELPLNIAKSGLPSVVTVHDVIYRILPHCYKRPSPLVYDYKYGRSLRNATAVIAISECTKRDVMQIYGVPEEKIEVIYQGCDPSFSPAVDKRVLEADESVRVALNLPKRYIVQVGTIERRKNALLSVRALSALTDPEIHLVLVGRETTYTRDVLREARRLGVAERVKVRADISFKQIPAVVRKASLSLYPSRYEGFGLPVLESISCGTPVIAATGSCLEESGGENGIYVDPDDALSLREAIDTVLGNPHVAERMRADGLRHAARFSNETTVLKTHALYSSILKTKIQRQFPIV